LVERNTVKSFISLGSNIGDGKNTLQGAWEALGNIEGIILDGLSSPYMTAPVDMSSQHWFTNAVGRLQVSFEPQELLNVLLEVENLFGRDRGTQGFGYQDRSLDLDLLYHGDVIMDTPDLTLPHPHIGHRLFVLVPFVELAPDFRDIVRGESIAAIERRLQESIADSTSKKQEIIRGTWNEQPALVTEQENQFQATK
jgi:2-amino-4-hydroxy-6-hydroxymethyldihydropteridine diphosphokinase